MPEKELKPVKISGWTLFPGWREEMGRKAFSQTEIIRFAEANDPLPVHIDPLYAQTTPFGGIIASGSHLFMDFHKNFFIPRFGNGIVAGLKIDNWQFLRPHFPDIPVLGEISLLGMEPKWEKGVAVLHWEYRFSDPSGELLQSAEFKILHRLDSSEH